VKARVYVTLKDGVLDPAGKATAGGLRSLGYDEVLSVRLGKFIEVELDDRPDGEARLVEMCEKLLANTVIEKYRIELER
jgi:phosphoribosylformylglycinamidine synthase PurS subunit